MVKTDTDLSTRFESVTNWVTLKVNNDSTADK